MMKRAIIFAAVILCIALVGWALMSGAKGKVMESESSSGSDSSSSNYVSSSASTTRSTSSSAEGSYQDGVVLVLFKHGYSEEEVLETLQDSDIVRDFSVNQSQINEGEYVVVKLQTGVSVPSAVGALKRFVCVETAQPNYRYGVAANTDSAW